MDQHAFWKSCEGTSFSNKYYLQQLLGVGGFGAVFKADEVVADRCIRTVALKIFNPFQASNLDAFIQEFQTTANLRHPHLIETYALEEGKLERAGAALGLVMELAGEDLGKQLGKLPLTPLTPTEATRLVQHVAGALQYLHGISDWNGKPTKGVVHRDIKPQNIMAVGSGANLLWKVGDLGIVRVLGNQTATMTPNRQGSPFYVPPEAYSGEVSPAMDVWALGVTIVQALTLQVPFPGPTEAQVMHQVLNEDPKLPPLPEPFGAIVRGCFQKDPKSRWTAEKVLEALNPPKPQLTPQQDPEKKTSFLSSLRTRLRQAARLHPTPSPKKGQDLKANSPVAGMRSEQYTFETVVNTDSAGMNGQRKTLTVTRWIEDLGNGVVLHLVRIPAGSFTMGSPTNEDSRDSDEGPQHRVNFPNDFWMGQFAVTQAQYQAITGKNPSYVKSNNQNPVESVSWKDAVAFCQQLSKTSKRNYRLPTEAEWEYACRAGTTSAYHFGESITPDFVNYGNEWGLYDMHGNLYEWCQDEWNENYNEKPKTLKENGSIAWEDKTTSSSSDVIHVLRGGSWVNVAGDCRSAIRPGIRFTISNIITGFRLVLSSRTP